MVEVSERLCRISAARSADLTGRDLTTLSWPITPCSASLKNSKSQKMNYYGKAKKSPTYL